jgi:hypothetical protein
VKNSSGHPEDDLYVEETIEILTHIQTENEEEKEENDQIIQKSENDEKYSYELKRIITKEERESEAIANN